MNNVGLAFISGLTAGGVSCLSVQGGLLASSLSNIPNGKKNLGTSVFVICKILSHIALGGILGFFGQRLVISSNIQGWIQIVAGFYMFCTAANLLELHPIFRYVVIQPPKWGYKLLKKESQKDIFGAAILGALTILIPCGITQGMMILSVSSGSFIQGALILAAFTIGTSPLFFIVGRVANEVMKKKSFIYLASILIILLGANSINAGNILRGSVHTFNNYLTVLKNEELTSVKKTIAAMNSNGEQNVNINVSSSGYNALQTVIKVNVPVRVKLISDHAIGCVQVFTIPKYNIRQLIPQNGEGELVFTPTEKGRLSFSCAMGMHPGYFYVI